MMAQGHTVKSFDDDLRQLRSLIGQMGGIAEAQIIGSLDALKKRDVEMAHRIIAADKALDLLESDAEKLAITIIARRAPMADDLREIISALKISALLERIGDYAKNIAKRTTVLASAAPIQPQVIIPEMGKLVARMVKDVLDAYANRDVEKALAVWQQDQTVDEYYNSLFRTLLTYMFENPQQITPSAHVLFIAKNIERIGDHATNIAEIVHFNATGHMIDADRPKGDTTAYVTTPAGDQED
jgi:phosphate transport system protein